MEATSDRILDGLERLRSAKRQPKVFGAESHQFRLNPALSESAVEKFETEHRIRLPEDYRGFLIKAGNGGAGPFYGVFKLGEMDDSFDFQKWKEGDGFIGVLSKPFPHTRAWNDVTGEPEDSDDEEAYEKAIEAFDRRYWNAENVNGAIPVCHEGCAYRDWLVVTGPEAGHVWHDARTDRAGLYPISIGRKKRVTFLEWHVDWLNESVAKLPNRRG
ncbi:MAG TPA: hypothetical protein VGN57_01220 [Pirellulaceae bacterium]|nr:hypothetical protein [Pirellulaceae bacterium]